MGGQYQILTSILFMKSKLQCRSFIPFCNSKILFHKISVRSNTVFYNLSAFIILEPIPLILFKASNLELYFCIFLLMTQSVCYKTIARLKHYSKNLFLKYLSQKVLPTQTLMLRLNMQSVPLKLQCQYLPLCGHSQSIQILPN